MKFILNYLRKKIGACPKGHPGTNDPIIIQDLLEHKLPSSLPVPIVSSPTNIMSPEFKQEYRDNVLLIILLVGGFSFALDMKYLYFFGILSAIVVYYDAIQLHAGKKFETESLLGNVVAWRPITWAIFVFIGSLFFLAIYTFSRREIFNANN